MGQKVILALVVAGLALLGAGSAAAWWPGGGPAARAHEDDSACATDDRFMGLTDPAAPYDLRFIDEMIMHHQGAIVSAEMMIADSERPELRDLARRIVEGQRRQIEQLREWRETWYPDAPPPPMDMDPMDGMMDGDEGMGDMMGMMGMMGSMMGGDRADEMFLRMMIPHHQLAIEMAEDALRHVEHEELKDLARAIIADQSAEIEEMEGYLRDWYGAASTRHAAGPMGEMMRSMMGRC